MLVFKRREISIARLAVLVVEQNQPQRRRSPPPCTLSPPPRDAGGMPAHCRTIRDRHIASLLRIPAICAELIVILLRIRPR